MKQQKQKYAEFAGDYSLEGMIHLELSRRITGFGQKSDFFEPILL
jgi:hypothetical protein